MDSNKLKAVWGLLRLSMGLIFLWAFVDKLWGLGFATPAERAWTLGGSPTTGFLTNAVHGPFAGFFNSLAGSGLVDWLFMLGLLFVGVTLTLGIMVRLGAYTGALMFALMYLAVGIQPENHPFIDDHLTNFLVMLGFAFSTPGRYFGLGNKWWNTPLVQKYPWLA
jgi:thiosulfate dehydrogenase (quinone) large subunit